MAFYLAKVTRVIDGDTIVADVKLGFSLWKHDETIRLNGIDAPELKGESRERGKIARDYLKTLILDQEVQLETFDDKRDRWGRLVAGVYVADMQSITAMLLERGHAIPYIGDIFEGNT